MRLSFPATPTAGHVLIAGISYHDGSEASVSAPSGWAHITTAASGTTGVSVSTFYHTVASGEANGYSFGISGPHAQATAAKAFDTTALSSGPVHGSWVTTGSAGTSASSPSVAAPGADYLPIAFLVQDIPGKAPAGYESTAGWSDPYQAIFTSAYDLAAEAHAGPLTTSGTIAYTQTWVSTVVGAKAAVLVLLNPGSSSPAPTPTPAPTATPKSGPPPSPPPSGAGSLHIPDYAYYQGLNKNTRISASWLAQHYTMTQYGAEASYGAAFIAAGGKYGMPYTDPNFVPDCTWPATYRCTGPMGNVLPNESSWLHASNGTRLHVVSNGSQSNGNWQERLNPADPAVQAAFAAFTAAAGGNSVFADDASASVDPTPAGGSDYDMYK
ncbi:MAG: hypothetical protein ABI231_02080, partial [Candidatus Tumulicola sp.]